jgi:tRNA-splicing ligase RtcB
MPRIDGKTLIEMGYEPGPWFKAALLAALAEPEAAELRPVIDRVRDAWLAAERKKIDDARAQARKALPAGVAHDPGATAPAPVVVGEHDAGTVAQMNRCLAYGSVLGGAICADGHLGYAQPVGGVIAYREHVSVSGVGFDIACGNMAVRTDLATADLGDRDALADRLARSLSFGIGRNNAETVEHALLDDADAWREGDVEDLRQMAGEQLGTIGSGNHYVDLFADPEDRVWIGVHFGSRGFGHKAATRYLQMAGGKEGIDVPPTVLHVESEIGRRYLAAMRLAGRYAYAGREWVVGKVLDLIGGAAVETVHNHHNFAWEEDHGDAGKAWVVRKGATPAFPGQRGFVGGSMGDDAVIVEGVGGAASKAIWRSTIHGAGRTFGRREAIRRFARPEMDAWLRERRVTLRGAGLDESPMAYRRLDAVLAHHADTIRVVTRLRPLVVVMAGAGEVDPYKD